MGFEPLHTESISGSITRMKPFLKIVAACIVGTAFMFATFLFVPALVVGDSFSIMKEQELHLFSEPLDLAISSDGSWTFVLTKSGMVTIYGASGDLIQSLVGPVLSADGVAVLCRRPGGEREEDNHRDAEDTEKKDFVVLAANP